MPKVFEEGYVLNVKDDKKDELDVIIKTNRQTLSSHDTLPVYLKVKTGEGNFLARMDVTYLAQSLTLKKNSFPPGIAHLTLYDKDFKPHCERLVYMDPSHVRSYLFLESELRGVVENPGYYFNDEHADRHRKMDLLLLTQGWRDFIWKYPSDTTIQINYPAEEGLTITGRLLTALGKRPMVDASISMAIMGEYNSYVDLTSTDSLGKYRFSNLDFRGSERITVSAMNKKGRTRGIILLDSILWPDIEVEYSWAPSQVQEQFVMGEYIEDASVKRDIMKQYNLSDTIPIEEVMIRARWRTPRDEHQRIYRKPDAVVEVRDYERHYNDIFELIQGKIPGVIISGGYPYYGIYIRGISNLRGDTQTLFLLDGMPVDMGDIINIPVQSVDKIEVLKNIENTAMYGSLGANGVICVYTNKEIDTGFDQPAPYTINTEIMGYDEDRIFYAPRYDKPRPEHQAPDLRTTIHWSPFVQTTDRGGQEITFFNADIPATIVIMVEGITGDGIPVYSRTSYQVK